MGATSMDGAPLMRARLAEHERRLLAAPGDAGAPARRSAVEALLGFVQGCDDGPALAELRRAGELAAWRERFAPFVLAHTDWAERRVRQRILAAGASGGARLGDTLAAQPWGAYARVGDTLRLIDVSRCQTVVMAGCGPLPDTLVYLHEHTRAERLVGLDSDAGAARLARELAEAAGLARVELRHADATRWDYAGADLIVLSVFASPRRAVLERIAATASGHAHVLLRDPFGPGELLFEPLLRDLPRGLRVAASAPLRRGPFMLGYHALTLSASGDAAASRKDRSTNPSGSPST